MINENKSLSMAEVLEYAKDKESDVVQFIKKFAKLTPKEAKELRGKLDGLELMKMKPEHISKIIDVFPDTTDDLNKIFIGVSLDEDESKKILETIKEYK